MKFELNDLAHIDHAKFNDDKDITVLVGENGTGKTLLLETVLLIKKKKKAALIKLLSELKFEQELLKISFSNDDALTDFLVEEELKFQKTFSKDLKSIEEQILLQFNNDDDEFEWKGDANFILSNPKSIENLINKELKKIQSDLPEMISNEILFNSDDDARVKISEDKITLTNEYNIELSFKTMNNNQIWRIQWLDSKGTSKTEYEFLKKKQKPISFFREMLTKILYEYILVESLGFSTHSQILMVPTERSHLMLSSNEDFKKLIENQSSRMRYSEASFLSDYFLNKDFMFLPGVMSLSDTYKKMLGGKLEIDNDDNIIGVLEDSGNLIDWRLLSTKQNRIIPYVLVETLIISNELQLIIEEPESNLSLKSIREIVNYIFELITQRPNPVKVILTTHSDVFFQILNLELLKNKSISSRVYEFKKKKDRNVLVECTPNEYGYSTEIFGKELEKLYIETQILQNDIDESGSDVEIIDMESDGGSEK